MKRLEIIHLRSLGEALDSLGDRIRDSIGAASEEREVVTSYRRHGLETDLALHILRPDVAIKTGPSDLAPRLASELRACGLVEHTLWEEQE